MYLYRVFTAPIGHIIHIPNIEIQTMGVYTTQKMVETKGTCTNNFQTFFKQIQDRMRSLEN